MRNALQKRCSVDRIMRKLIVSPTPFSKPIANGRQNTLDQKTDTLSDYLHAFGYVAQENL
jgi:hypothetical protein